MPHSLSADKALRQSEKRRLRNKSVRSGVKTRTTTAEKLVQEGDMGVAPDAVKEAVRSLDRAAKKGVIHANTAARRKSRLVKKLNVAQMETPRPKRKRTRKAATKNAEAASASE
ncbi:MAG: 30S ribosomal protein S20 [Dehalococcoidia bacterium]|nr:30S ribosomal protein S20 [Dehalococcoidia bacterium]